MNEAEKNLSSKIKSFDKKPAEEVAPPVEEAPLVDEGTATRLAVAETRIGAVLDELTDILEREVGAVHELRYDYLAEAADRKEALLVNLDGLIEEASADASRAWMAQTFEPGLRKLSIAARYNEKALKLLEETVRQVVGLHIRAEKEMGSEGLYGSSGRQVEPAELSLVGMKFDL